jgi:DNA-binding NtrC family response regulator
MSQRILVVEDQPDNRQILRDLLTSAEFEVIEAVDGQAGLPHPRPIDQTSFLTGRRLHVGSKQARHCMPFR